jgi:glycine hydroxymethyltransferase
MLASRPWLPRESDALVQAVAAAVDAAAAGAEIEELLAWNDGIVAETINLNPAANVMNPRAEAALARGLGSRPSLGYPGAKHETGVEALERIEIVAAELAARVFGARYVELRLPSGSIANLCAFAAATVPGDTIVVPPGVVGGHASHHAHGAAGLCGLALVEAPVDAARYQIDLDALRAVVRTVRPKLIVAGGSLNLFPPPIRELRAIADEAGALLLYDAAHTAGLLAGGAWPQPLAEGAHLLTMSTYKSLGGPPAGMVLTNDPALAERIERVAFPGLTGNADVAKAAALAIALGDAHVHGRAYAEAMVGTAQALAAALAERGVACHAADLGATASHQFAVAPDDADDGVRRLRHANLLATTIRLPTGAGWGIRMGTPEIVRRGMTAADMPELADLIACALSGLPCIGAAQRTRLLRGRFTGLRYIS